MKNKVWLFKPIFYVLIVLCVLLTLLTGIFGGGNMTLFYVEAGLTLVAFLFVLLRLRSIQKEIGRFLQQMGQTLSSAQQKSLTNFPIPVLVTNKHGEIVWYNALFEEKALGEEGGIYGASIVEMIPNIEMEHLAGSEGYEISFRGKMFTVYAVEQPESDPGLCVFYFIDDTRLKQTAIDFENTRPSVGVLMIDNCEELLQAAHEDERAQLIGRVEYALLQYVSPSTGLLKKLERDKYLMVVEAQHLRKMVENRFSVLDRAREIMVGDTQMPATLSIGIGSGASSLRESEQMARQALEMALGRGGDQVAMRTANGYEFFGGVSKGIEKRTKVKTRIVAAALLELIESSENVLVMGHQFADLDCVGAAVGMLKGVRSLGKPVSVVLQKNRNLAQPLYERLVQNGYEDVFIEPEAALGLITKKTLLIVVDTHIQHILESQDVYNAAKTVVVIDHHRKMVGHIDRAVIFYHEPYASSASEMVTELLQYFGDGRVIGRLEAESLLAGIMLDTRNFVLRTGVRTFEAAAYLRKQGADTVEVRRLFASSVECYQHKAHLVAGAELYGGCAIACSGSNQIDDIKLAAPQAADELLGISGVDASFVLYQYGDGVSFSARSMGGINVQLIMEKLGGGGHLTMAGAQMAGVTLKEAKTRLVAAIDTYHHENAAKQQNI